MPEKIIIYPKKKREQRESIKDICFKYFQQDLSIRDIIDMGYKESSVKYYRGKFVAEQIYKHTRRGDEFILETKKPFSTNEMDYGTDLPTYTYDELTQVEKVIYDKI
jgi:hypothetical protein